jgi:hypothetical protein
MKRITTSFICPECSTEGSLKIIQSLALPPDSRSDDIILQILECQKCNFRGAAIYEESRRGAFDSGDWEHLGYHVHKEQLDALSAVMAGCPDPGNIRCQCQVHDLLGQRKKNGRWRRPAGFVDQRTFPMPLV